MSDNSIHDFDLDLICEYYSALDRQGPGSPEVTSRALGLIHGLTENSRILDIGCGTGGQTMLLAEQTPAHITAVDLFPEFIRILEQRTQAMRLQDRVQGIVATMEDLPFEDEVFDLIWSEGAIYNIGFQRGLREWRRLLPPGGFIAVSEACWLSERRPQEIDDFWNDAYPGIDTAEKKVEQLEEAGYEPVGLFTLPENCWIDNFYAPQVSRQELFLKKHAGDQNALELVANQRHEAELYSKYRQYYGYVFFIGRKA